MIEQIVATKQSDAMNLYMNSIMMNKEGGDER